MRHFHFGGLFSSQRGTGGEQEDQAQQLEQDQAELLSHMADQQAADLLQQMVEEEAEFGLYPWIDPGLYY